MKKLELNPNTKEPQVKQLINSALKDLDRKDNIIYAIDDAYNFLVGSEYDFVKYYKSSDITMWYHQKGLSVDSHLKTVVIAKVMSLFEKELESFSFDYFRIDFQDLREILRLITYLKLDKYTIYYTATKVYVTKDVLEHSILTNFDMSDELSIMEAVSKIRKELIR